eukprot:Rhum_TRINITY_DN24938_c0_g1::Rhum_TRINITY_DN24938_c0_g1_i1::g.180520::m.180520
MAQTKKRLLLLAPGIVVLYFALWYDGGSPTPPNSPFNTVKPACDIRTCGAHGTLKDCKCRCSGGYTGKVCEVSPPKRAASAQEDTQKQASSGNDDDSSAERETTEEDSKPNPATTPDAAAKVLEDMPYLQYANEGERACHKMNAAWRERTERAYGGSKAEISGREGIHLFFTTDCARHSLWQAFTLENTWAKVKHPGALTRVVSGCFTSSGEKKRNADLMSRRVIHNPKHFIFYGPKVGGAGGNRKKGVCGASEEGWYDGAFLADVGVVDGLDECKEKCRIQNGCASYNFRHSDKMCHLFKGRTSHHAVGDHSTGTCTGEATNYAMPSYLANYAPINRPCTAMYWLLNAKPLERVVGLLDPDMVFFRPILWHIEGQVVERGKPVGQFYDYLVSQGWDAHYSNICTDKQFCKPLGRKRDFAPGPPHLMHRQDWVDLAPWWVRYTVHARHLWGEWTSEMAGMSIGLARLGLRSRLEPNGMWDRTPPAANALQQLGLTVGGAADRGWMPCANEGELCEIPDGEAKVRYGAGSHSEYITRDASGKVYCSHRSSDLGTAYFDHDPAPGKAKVCQYFKAAANKGNNVPMGDAAAEWVYCADDGGECRLPSHEQYTVRYGLGPVTSFAEKTHVKGGENVKCESKEGDAATFDMDPAPEAAGKQCFYKQETGLVPPYNVARYVPQAVMPNLLHYCFTLEVNKEPHPEKLWRWAKGQIEYEHVKKKPLMEYMHWSKYRSLTDWGGNDAARTLLECDSNMLFQFPPLPHMLDNWAKTRDDAGWQLFFAAVVPAINEAVTKYKLHYCDDRPSINYHKIVRTAHDQWWISLFETVQNASVPEGFSFIPGPTN